MNHDSNGWVIILRARITRVRIMLRDTLVVSLIKTTTSISFESKVEIPLNCIVGEIMLNCSLVHGFIIAVFVSG